jgi:hypothetical protein
MLSLVRNVSALMSVIDTASKMLVPLGIMSSLVSERYSIAAKVALAACTFL